MVFIESNEEVNITCAVCKAEMTAIAKFCGNCGAPRAYATGSERYERTSSSGRTLPQQQSIQASAVQSFPTPPTTESNTFSILGIVFGGIAFLFLPILFGPAGIGFAVAAMIKKEKLGGAAIGVSVAGTVLGMIFGFLFWGAF